MDRLQIPGTSKFVAEGYVVVLQRYPNTKWVVHNGWYTYNGRRCNGWYFQSIPNNTYLPCDVSDLKSMRLVSTSCGPDFFHPCDCGCDDGKIDPGFTFPGKPSPPVECNAPTVERGFNAERLAQLKAAFISVDSLKDRNFIPESDLADGRICRVADVDGEEKFYIWSADNDRWEDYLFDKPIDLSDYATDDALQSAIDELKSAIESDIESAVASLRSDLESSANAKFEEIDTKISTSESHVHDLESQAVAKFSEVDSKLADIYSQTTSISGNVSDLYTKVDDLATSVDSRFSEGQAYIDGKVDSINATLEVHKTNITNLDIEIQRQDSEIEEANKRIDDVSDAGTAAITAINSAISSIESALDIIRQELESASDADSAASERLEALESAVFDIQKLSNLLDSNNVLVSDDGSIASTDYTIGGDTIDSDGDRETSLATESAVVEAIQESKPKWVSF